MVLKSVLLLLTGCFTNFQPVIVVFQKTYGYFINENYDRRLFTVYYGDKFSIDYKNKLNPQSALQAC